jgi:methyl-accepting chemotaxis protein
MKATTTNIGGNIDMQNAQARHLTALRTLVALIADAKDEEALSEADKKLQPLRDTRAAKTTEQRSRMLETVEQLLSHKRNQLEASSELSALRKSNIAALEEVTKLAMRTADDVEFDSTMKIDHASTEGRGNFDDISVAAGTALSAIKAALFIRAYSSELNAKVRDALLATDVALVDYAQTEVTTLIDNIRNEIAVLPEHEAAGKLDPTVNKLAGLIEKMFKAKKQMLTAEKELNQTSAIILQHMGQLDNSMLVAATGTKSNADKTLQASTRLVTRWRHFQILLGFGAVILALVIGIYVSNSISKPLGDIAKVARNVAVGSLACKEIRTSDDEVGQVNASFRKVVDSLQEITSVCEAIADGDLGKSVEVRSEDDALGKAVNQMIENLKEANRDTGTKISYLNNIPTPVHVIDKDFNIQFMNKAGASLVNRTVDECIGKKCYELYKTELCNTEKCPAAMAMGSDKTVVEDVTAIVGEFHGLEMRYTCAALKDEAGSVVGSIEYLVDISDEQTTVKVAEKISEGDYSVTVKERSEKDTLSIALNRMTKTLREVTEENEKQDWFKTGQTELNDRMRGEKDIPTLCRDIISFLARYLNAQVGTIYVRGDDHNLTLAGSYALKKRGNRHKDVKFGEGLIGQAAVDRKSRILSELPDDYIEISSGLAEMVPRNILVIPVQYEGQVNGVIELGSLNEFSDRQLGFLNQVSEHIGIGVNSAQSRQKMHEMLGLNNLV